MRVIRRHDSEQGGIAPIALTNAITDPYPAAFCWYPQAVLLRADEVI